MRDEVTVIPLVDILTKQLEKQVVMSNGKYVLLKDKTEVSQSDIDSAIVEQFKLLKDDKIAKLKNECRTEIISGFISDALGSTYTYQSEEIDQLNLIGVVTAGADDVFKCSADGGSTWEYKMHTIAQLQQVLSDGKVHKQALLAKLEGLKTQVSNATTKEELDAIVW